MQEESGESVQGQSSVSVWPCPLCQQEWTDRDSLAQHLTDKHSVLPACLDRLLDTAMPVQNVSEVEETDIQSQTDALCTQQMPSEPNGAPSDLDRNAVASKQGAVNTRLLRGSRAKAAPQPETEVKSEEEEEQEGAKDKLEAGQEKSPHSESTKPRKVAPKKDSSSEVSSIAHSTNTSKATNDPMLERFLDPNRPYKCNACLESFPSKSALGVHYSSASHLQRMRMGSVKQGDESDTSSSSSSNSSAASQSSTTRPFISNKPYQCAVCRVSYNHAFTLESHMKSVLHQTRSRNAVNTISGNSDKKGTVNSGSITTTTSAGSTPIPVTEPAVSASQSGSASTGTSGIQGSLNASSGATKDTEQSQTQSVPSTCPPSAPALSLLSSPVASAQAVSAFLTLLTSSSHSVAPSLFAANANAAPSSAAPQLELIAQQQLLLPLFLNGLQTQNQSSSLETPNAVLTQSVPLLGLSATQQALLAQRLSSMQNQSTGLATGLATCLLGGPGQNEREEAKDVEGKLGKEVEDVGESGDKKASPTRKSEADSEVLEKSAVENEGEKCCSKSDSTSKSEQNMDGDVNVENNGNAVTVGNDATEQLEVKESMFNKADELQNASDAVHDAVHQQKSIDAPGIHTATASLCHSDTACPGNADSSHPTRGSPSQSSSPNLDNNKSRLLNCISTELKCSGATSLNPAELSPAPDMSFKSSNFVLSEFQSQVLWAFLESRSETDAASPLREDCEALGKEVGLDEEAVRTWLGEARRARERQKGGTGKAQVEERNKAVDQEEEEEEEEEEEGTLTIVETEGESPTTSSHAIDLSHSSGRGREKEQGRESPGESCLTSDSDNDGLYTSFIVTDEESQNSSVREELGSPAREEMQRDEKESRGGGKVLRSSTVFLSDAEDSEEDEEGANQKMKKRKRRREAEEMEVKAIRLDPDVDLELEAQADPPPLSVSVEQQTFPSIAGGSTLQSLSLSHSLAPFATQFLNPYVLSLPPTAVGLGIAEGDGDRDRGRGSTFTNPPAITRCSAPFLDSLKAPPPASHMSPARSLSNGGVCESALDLSIGKKHSSTTACSSSSIGDKTVHLQRDHALEGLGLTPTAPGAGGLIVVRVKPDSAVAIPASNSSISSNNNSRTSTVYIRAAERVNASMMEKERGKQQDKETESEKQQKNPKARRFRDMRRSRTIIQTEQLDVLYGCYFKDPNPGKHEFERISEWVHLPKKVVQIWFQNMRARERKGEVRFISDGTLAAVGKPLIKFTWPLTLPIFSSSPTSNTSSLSSSGIAKASAGPSPVAAAQNIRTEKEKGKEKEESTPKHLVSPPLPPSAVPRMPKPKAETQNQVTVAKPVVKAVAAAPVVPIVVMKTRSSPSSHPSQKRKRSKDEEGEEEEKTDEEEEDHRKEKGGPGSTNRMVPKMSSALAVKSPASETHKRNGLSDWSPKSPFKINTLSREQLPLSSGRTPVTTATATPTPSNASTTAKSGSGEGSYLHHSTPRRPRTHLTSLQVSIMQSCYETCPHPNALECETVGTELGLPLKVVQIWFQNTRAKEKRWRLQLQKQSPNTESSKKVDTSSGSFLLYNALRANRPILPKPVQLTVLEPSAPPGLGQPAGRETLRGRCDACAVEFESRAAGRTHVFSPRHLATLRSTNFGQPPSLVNKSSATGSSSASGVAVQSSPNPASTTS